MKGLNLKSFVKHLSMAALGMVVAAGVLIAPKFNAKADENVNYDPDKKILTISGTIVNDPDKGIVLPTSPSINKSEVEAIVISESAVFPENASSLFIGFSNLNRVRFSGPDTSNLKNMSFMFDGLSNLEDVEIYGINTAGVTNMAGMFQNCSSLTELNLSSFTVSQIRDNSSKDDNMSCMFFGCSNLKRIIVNDDWNIDLSVHGSDMFLGDFLLVGGNGTEIINPTNQGTSTNATYAKIDKVGQMGYLSSSSRPKISAQLKTDGGRFSLLVFVDQGEDRNKHIYKAYYGDLENPCAEIELGGTEATPRIGSFELKAVAKEINNAKPLIIKKDDIVVFQKDISVAYYLRRLCQEYDKTTPTYQMAGSMLRYGAAAQKYFNYNTSDLANKEIDGFTNFTENINQFSDNYDSSFDPADMNTALSEAGYKDDKAVTYSAMNLSFDEDLTFMMAFKVPSNSSEEYVNDSKLSDLIKNKHKQGDQDDANYSLKTGGPSYIVTMTQNINVKYLDQALFSSDDFGQDVTPVLYLYRVYKASSNQDMKNLAISLYDFHVRAKAYQN